MFTMLQRRSQRAVTARRIPYSFMLPLIAIACVVSVPSLSFAERVTQQLNPQQDRSSADASQLAAVPEHGLGATKGCFFRCVGETTDCTATAVFLDDFEDALVIKEAYDEVNTGSGVVRIPAVGNLPIVTVLGNAICTDDGGICDPVTGTNCALPCTIGPTGFAGSSLPGLIGNGRVRFAQNQYVIQPGDVPNLGDTVFFVWEDLCNSGSTSCPVNDLTTPAGSNTIVPDCNDNNDCTADICFEGACSNEPDCLDDPDCDDGDVCTTNTCTAEGCCDISPICLTSADCNDGDACTEDVCLASGCCENTPLCPSIDDCDDNNVCTTDICGASGCCENTPECMSAIDCDDADICTTDSCTAEGCCENTPECTSAVDCNDGDDCTADSCTVDGCCENIPLCESAIDCDDQNVCTLDACGPDGCCEHVRECMTASDCDDGDVCTSDTCSPEGCCISEPLCVQDQDCDDGNVCTANACGPDGCCEAIPDCTTAADCDDGNECTGDSCSAAGCCEHSEKVCSDGNSCTLDECVRGTGCVFTKLDPLPLNCVNVPAMSQWATTVLVLALGVMIAIRFGSKASEPTS